ncbi:MAG: SEC-C domain-containing protein [Gallionella sp.]|nr:SEC-C domain-containing protein [Gallionella sp.]
MAKILPDENCPCGSNLQFKDCHGPKVRTRTPPPIKHKIALKIIPEPDPGTRAVFEMTNNANILFQGFETEIGLVCGACSKVLAAGINREQIINVVLKCNQCGAFNEV